MPLSRRLPYTPPPKRSDLAAHPMTDTLDLRLANDVAEIPAIAERLDAFFEAHDLPPKVAFNFNLAIDELLTNTISYGFPPDTRHEIRVRVTLSADRVVTAELIDDGAPFDPFTQTRPPVLEGEAEDRPIGGLGVHFVKTMMDDVRYERRDGRNHVVIAKRAGD